MLFLQEYITFNNDLAKSTEPLLSGDWKDSKLLLPFYGFTKEAYPEVSSTRFTIDLRNGSLTGLCALS